MTRKENLDKKTVRQLVRLYNSAPGADDAVGPEFQRRGIAARNELIQMLDTMPPAELGGEMAETIERILHLFFPSEESTAALERFHARYPAVLRGSSDLLRLTMMRAELSGQLNEAWFKEKNAKPLGDRDLHFTELLLANARPGDRVVFLVDAADAALGAYESAVRGNDRSLAETDARKAEAFAREILAIPNLAAKSGDGVYTAHRVLGRLALERGDIEAAKYHLIESSKTPGSWMLNRVPGPRMDLAWALVERGEYEVVCQFLDNVKVFTKWPPCPTPVPKDGLIDRWKEVVRTGNIPDTAEWFLAKKPRRQRRRRGQGSSEDGPRGD